MITFVFYFVNRHFQTTVDVSKLCFKHNWDEKEILYFVKLWCCEHLFCHQSFELAFSSHVHLGRRDVREYLLTVVSGEFYDKGRLTLGSGLDLLTHLFKTSNHEGVIECGKRDLYVLEMDAEGFEEEESPIEGLVTGKYGITNSCADVWIWDNF